MIIFAAEHLQR